MVKEIEAGMAEQLERVHEWWANNEMAPLPKSLGIVSLTTLQCDAHYLLKRLVGLTSMVIIDQNR